MMRINRPRTRRRPRPRKSVFLPTAMNDHEPGLGTVRIYRAVESSKSRGRGRRRVRVR